MKIHLTTTEAVTYIASQFSDAGMPVEVVIGEDMDKAQKIERFNELWKNCVHSYKEELRSYNGVKIEPQNNMKIPFIKLYRAMYQAAVGVPCDLSVAKNFVENHQ